MSRAFVKENDDAVEDVPERPISTAPNLVTAEGLAAIEAELARLDAQQDATEDCADLARIARDLRYWTARRSSAQLVPPPVDRGVVRFGAVVTLERDGERVLSYRIVGEDEAAPENGTISHVSPLARALLGKEVGDVVRVADHEFEITKIS